MTPGTQTCRGEHRNNSYRFRCDPLSVVIGVGLEDSDGCYVVFMQPALNDPDDSRVPSMLPRTKGQSQQCGELPIDDGNFEITVMPRSRSVDEEISD